MVGANLLKKMGKNRLADSSDGSLTRSVEVLRTSKKGLLRNPSSPHNASKVSLGPYEINS